MIGIFDSGIGGLGIYKEVRRLLPKELILYLADSKNCPYGEKSVLEIKKIALKNTEFLINKGCNIIVIACNTASTIALEYVRQALTKSRPTRLTFVRVVGVVPVVKTASVVSKNKRIGILATKKTMESKYLRDLVEQFCPSYTKVSEGKPQEKGFKVFYQAANDLVELIESGIMNYELRIKRKIQNEKCKATAQNLKISSSTRMKFGGEEISSRPALRQGGQARTIIKKYLQPFIKAKVDVVALGCTHFPFIKKEIQEIMGKDVKILDSNGAVARQVARIVSSIKYNVLSIKKPKYQFYTTGNPKKIKPTIEKLLGEKIDRLQKIR